MNQVVVTIAFRITIFTLVFIIPAIVGLWLSGTLEPYLLNDIPQDGITISTPKINPY